MDTATAVKLVNQFLHEKVTSTGISGLEGLVALLLQRATGQEFRLSSSGRQFGGDSGSEPGYANRIRIEVKHYRETTALNPRELIAEMNEATAFDPNLDVWVLATSRSVSDQISSSLNKHGESLGIDVVLLDLGINCLPRLAVLMAAFPGVVLDWADRHQLLYPSNELESAMLAIAGSPDFKATTSRLLAKLNSNNGYDSARRLAQSRLLKVLGDDRDARGAFRQALAIRATGARVVRRTDVSKQLDEWWEVPGIPSPAVVLGEEGTGKTWAAFDWVLDGIGRGDMPIVVPFAAVAEELNNPDPVETLLPHLLAKWTGIRDESRWRRRLHHWSRGDSSGRPLILLLVDGLNERASVNWRSFFSALSSDPWRDKIAVLATDRPHHWRTRCAMAGLATFREITLGGYSDAELDRALSASQISRSEIPYDLLALVSTPRYCRLVVDHYQEMIAAADFTRERLIYLEIKDRRASKLHYPFTDERLFEIVRDLAERARANPELNSKDLRSLIGMPGGDDENVYEEIVSGGLLVARSNGMTVSFRVEPLRLIYGFGMLLTAELADLPQLTSSEIEEFLTSWFEPQSDMDLKVNICGSAMFHALFQDDFPEIALRELIRHWLGLRNWADTAQSAFTAYVLRRPKTFVEVAEDFWSSDRDSGAAQEFLGEAFRAHRDDPRVQPVLAVALHRWMGFVHPLGRHFSMFDRARNEQMRKSFEAKGEKVALPADDAAKEERVRNEIQKRAGCPVIPGEIEVAGTKLTVISDGYHLRLARFGLMIMSAGNPSQFIQALVPWAVASAVMDDSGFGDLVSWVVRLSDGIAESALLREAQSLLARNSPTASSAARILLHTVGTAESQSLIEKHNLVSEWHQEQRNLHAKDPCKSFYVLTESETLACLGREDVPLHITLGRSLLPIVDPAVTLPDSLVRRAKETLWQINPATIGANSARTADDNFLEKLTPILCARAPSELANFRRAVVRTIADHDIKGRYFISVSLPKITLLLRAEEVSAVSRTIADLLTRASEWSPEDQGGSRYLERIAEVRAFSGITLHLGSSDFFRRFVARPKNALDLTSFELVFAPVPQDDVSEIIELLHAPPDQETLYRVLWALPFMGIALSNGDQDRLVCLAGSDDAKARAGAVRAAVIADDEALGRRMVDLGRAANKDTDHWEEECLTNLIGRFSDHLRFDDVVKRLRPSAIGFVIGQRGNRPQEIEIYTGCLDQEWQRIVSAVEPEIERLPEIETGSDQEDNRVPMPELREDPPSRSVRFDRSNSWTSGQPIDPDTLTEFFSKDSQKEARRLNQDWRCKIDAILAAWQTDAFQWYGRWFDRQAIDLLYQQHPATVERWITPALNNSLIGRSIRVRLGSFLEPICRVLLNRNPQLGLRLWNVLHKRESNPVTFKTVDIAFGTEDSHESGIARKTVLDECWDDESIARVAFACGRRRRHSWLTKAIEELVSADRLWKRAKGLTLASFSEISPPDFKVLVSKAAVQHTWVEPSIGTLGENVRRNHLARHWYSVFLSTEDLDAAWCAFQLVLALADERFLNWRGEVEEKCSDSQTLETRLRFLRLGWESQRNLRTGIDRQGVRKELLFGRAIQRGEIVPFMET